MFPFISIKIISEGKM